MKMNPLPLAAVLSLLIVPGAATAQEDDETAYIYASYYECGMGQGDAVATLRDDWGAIVQSHMDAGHISAWGILTHNTGNPWSMAIYHVGEDLGELNTALDEGLSQYVADHPDQMQTLMSACPRHEDYIWTTGPGSEAGAAVAQDRASAGMSVYYVCDEGREAVADLIVEQVMGPALDRQVQEGNLSSWGWISHFVGGELRRALVMDGPDHAAILEGRNQVIEQTGEQAALMAEFNNVCNGHQDVLWNIAVARP